MNDDALRVTPRSDAPERPGNAVITRAEEERWVPRGRVRLRTHSVTEDREISQVPRSEQVEISDARPRGGLIVAGPDVQVRSGLGVTESRYQRNQRRIDD